MEPVISANDSTHHPQSRPHCKTATRIKVMNYFSKHSIAMLTLAMNSVSNLNKMVFCKKDKQKSGAEGLPQWHLCVAWGLCILETLRNL